MSDNLEELLGIDRTDPVQALAGKLVDADDRLLRALVAIRKVRGLTQAEVGHKMGTTQPAVAAFERADADPKLSTIRRYALAVGAIVRHYAMPYLTATSSSPTIRPSERPPTSGAVTSGRFSVRDVHSGTTYIRSGPGFIGART